jgi:hypothetical protein
MLLGSKWRSCQEWWWWCCYKWRSRMLQLLGGGATISERWCYHPWIAVLLAGVRTDSHRRKCYELEWGLFKRQATR